MINDKKRKCMADSNKTHGFSDRLVRGTLIVAGTFFVGLGIVGIFLPLLPTTPFLLLGAACYARSSEKFYYWLLNNRWFGNYVKSYREGKGVPIKAKLLSISLLWITVTFSAVFIIHDLFIRVVLFLIAIGITTHILTIRTLKTT